MFGRYQQFYKWSNEYLAGEAPFNSGLSTFTLIKTFETKSMKLFGDVEYRKESIDHVTLIYMQFIAKSDIYRML